MKVLVRSYDENGVSRDPSMLQPIATRVLTLGHTVLWEHGDKPDVLLAVICEHGYCRKYALPYAVEDGLGVIPTVILRHPPEPDTERCHLIRGSLEESCSDVELEQALQEAARMERHTP